MTDRRARPRPAFSGWPTSCRQEVGVNSSPRWRAAVRKAIQRAGDLLGAKQQRLPVDHARLASGEGAGLGQIPKPPRRPWHPRHGGEGGEAALREAGHHPLSRAGAVVGQVDRPDLGRREDAVLGQRAEDFRLGKTALPAHADVPRRWLTGPELAEPGP
jgi:hypothetical protein